VCWVCGFLGSLSTQAGYRFGFSIEGNAVKNESKRLGDVGRLIEVGTPKGITRRNIARLGIIQFQYCVFQYDRLLKTKWKYHKVRRRTSGVAIFPHLGLPKPGDEVV